MEQILIKQLYDIETEAVKIIEETTQRKLELLERTDCDKRNVDKRIKEEYNKKSEEYASQQKKQFELKLSKDRENLANMEKAIHMAYEEHHNKIVDELLYQIIND